jgi:hypothetical protein
VDTGARMGGTPARPFERVGTRGSGHQAAWKAVAGTRGAIVHDYTLVGRRLTYLMDAARERRSSADVLRPTTRAGHS